MAVGTAGVATVTPALQANSAIPAYRTKPACDEAEPSGHAAGVLLIAPNGDVLLLRRSSAEKNFAGHWALPGGGVEAGETPEMGADREVGEEMGVQVKGPKKLLDRRRTPTGMIFHTFAQPVAKPFAPTLNDEHTGYAWAPLDQLPGPLHPAVEATIRERIGQDMSEEARKGFLAWASEEAAEHDDDLAATDSACRLAMDRDSVREKSREGHLHVAETNLSKATVSPYRGSEIPKYQDLGLDPDKIYHLLRDPEELARAAASFNGKPLLRKHVPVSAETHAHDETVGATGTSCRFDDPYLKNGLVIWSKGDIDDVEAEIKKELSAGYHYRADMTPGIFRGMRYDGVMRDIVGNHVALVKDGRAGPDVVVGDSMENLMTKPTRYAALVLASAASVIAPALAMDSKVTLPSKLFADVTPKNLKDKRTELLSGVRTVLDGKLRPGLALDATMEQLAKAVDAFGGAPDEPAAAGEIEKLATIEGPTAATAPATDAEPLKAFLREKGMAEDDIVKACDLMPKALAGDESDEAKKKAEEDAKKAREEAAAKDAEMKNMVTKPAMDAAIDAAVKAATKTARETERAIRVALDDVRPYVGELSPQLALDSADDVYRHAAVALSIPGAKDIHASALPTLIKMQPKPGARPNPSPIAMDSAQATDFNARFPQAGRIGAA